MSTKTKTIERFAPDEVLRMPRAAQAAGLSLMGARQIMRRLGVVILIDGHEHVRRSDLERIADAYALMRTGLNGRSKTTPQNSPTP